VYYTILYYTILYYTILYCIVWKIIFSLQISFISSNSLPHTQDDVRLCWYALIIKMNITGTLPSGKITYACLKLNLTSRHAFLKVRCMNWLGLTLKFGFKSPVRGSVPVLLNYIVPTDVKLNAGLERCASPLKLFCTSLEKSCTSSWESLNDNQSEHLTNCYVLW
jgi:hypothetical protein